MMKKIISLSLTLLLIAAPALAAPILYDNGRPTGEFSVGQWYLLADDFTLPVDTEVTRLSGLYSLTVGATWYIFDQNRAQPLLPGPLLFSGLVVALDGDWADVPPMLLMAQVRYWLGQYRAPLDSCHGGSAFATAATNPGTAPAVVLTHSQRFGCESGAASNPDILAGWDFDAGYWGRSGDIPDEVTDFSFQVQGHSVEESHSVPEPGLLLLMAGGVALAVRRARTARR